MARKVLKHKIPFDMEIQDVKQLKDICSDTFVIEGMKWNFKIEKQSACEEENRLEDTVAIWLHCNIPNELKDNMCGAQAKIKLVSFKDEKESKQVCINHVYDSNSLNWGFNDFIEWKKLFNDGYVRDDVILFEFELKVGRLEHEDFGSLATKTIEDKYEGEQLMGKLMKLVLNRPNDNFVATKSPKFNWNGLLWVIEIGKWFKGERDYYRFMMHSIGEQTSDEDWSSQLSGTLKLMPAKADFEPIEKCFNFEFDKKTKNRFMNIIEWSEMEERFLKNDAIEMMLELKVEK